MGRGTEKQAHDPYTLFHLYLEPPPHRISKNVKTHKKFEVNRLFRFTVYRTKVVYALIISLLVYAVPSLLNLFGRFFTLMYRYGI